MALDSLVVGQSVGCAASGQQSGRPMIALDSAEAGVGDVVVYTTASEAAIPFRPAMHDTPLKVPDTGGHENRCIFGSLLSLKYLLLSFYLPIF